MNQYIKKSVSRQATTVLLDIPSGERYIDAERLFRQISRALHRHDLRANQHSIVGTGDGSVILDSDQVYTPVRPRIAGRGAT